MNKYSYKRQPIYLYIYIYNIKFIYIIVYFYNLFIDLYK